MIGGTIGFAIGGPLGAIAGAVLGGGFDRREVRHFSQEGFSKEQNRMGQSNMTFFLAAFSMLAKIAKADGKITKEEIDVVEQFMSKNLKLDAPSKEYAKNIFRNAADSNESFSAFAQQFYEHFRNQPQIVEIMLETFLKVSIADNDFNVKEEALILEAVKIFNYGDQNYEILKSKFIKDTDKFYKILKCSKSDSLEKIKKQYRKLATEYHPDKIIAKGLPEEFVELANEKFKEIKEAFDQVKKEKE